MVKNKLGACMADGGITQQETPEQLMARMAAKYGAPTGATQQAQPQPQSTQQAPQPPKSNPLGIMSMLKGRSAQIDKAVNGYANGGIAGGVKFEGKGGPRDDQIPVKVAGQNINVSDGEQALIIPAKTAANAQAMAMIKKIIADSNDGRQPDMGHGDSNFADGGIAKPYEKKDFSGEFLGGVKNWMASKTPVSSEEDAAKLRGADDPFIVSPVGPVGKLVGAQTVKAGIQQYADDAAKLATSSAGDAQNIAAISRPLIAADAKQLGGVSREMASAATEKAAQDARFAAAATQAAVPVAAQKTGIGIGRNVAIQGYGATNRIGQTPSIVGNQPENYGNEGRSVPTEITKDNPGAVARINSDQPATPNPMMQDMPLTTKDIVPGGYSDRGAGIISSRNKDGRLAVSNVGTQGIADMSKGVMDDSASAAARHAADVKSGNTVQQVYDRMLRNRLTADANDPTITDPAVRQQAVQGLGIMGNPAENQLKQAQAQGIMAQTESAQMLADIQKKALAGDPQAMASYKALTQKGGTDYKDRYITLPNRKVYNDMGQIVGEESGGLFDAATGKPVDSGAGQPKQGGAQKFSSPADVAAAKAAGTIKSGDVIETPNGLIKVK